MQLSTPEPAVIANTTPHLTNDASLAARPSKQALRRYLRHGTLPQLAALDETLRQGSFSRAAETLCMAQPTLSGHIRKLSESVGVPLFEPQGRQMVPTDAALALQQATSDIMAALARVDQVLRQMRESPAGAAAVAAAAATAAMAGIALPN